MREEATAERGICETEFHSAPSYLLIRHLSAHLNLICACHCIRDRNVLIFSLSPSFAPVFARCLSQFFRESASNVSVLKSASSDDSGFKSRRQQVWSDAQQARVFTPSVWNIIQLVANKQESKWSKWLKFFLFKFICGLDWTISDSGMPYEVVMVTRCARSSVSALVKAGSDPVELCRYCCISASRVWLNGVSSMLSVPCPFSWKMSSSRSSSANMLVILKWETATLNHVNRH